MMDFRSLEIFIWVAELRSFSRAADRLNIAPPAVGARIRALEQFLNVRLVTTDHHRVALTPEGHELVVHAEMTIGQNRAGRFCSALFHARRR